MELTEVTEDLYNNPWRCIECKICEICRELGDDVRRFIFHSHLVVDKSLLGSDTFLRPLR